jgi:hypothetical protein
LFLQNVIFKLCLPSFEKHSRQKFFCRVFFYRGFFA